MIWENLPRIFRDWKISTESGNAVISTDSAMLDYAKRKNLPDEEHYGGLLICESAHNHIVLELILKAPEMFKLLLDLLNTRSITSDIHIANALRIVSTIMSKYPAADITAEMRNCDMMAKLIKFRELTISGIYTKEQAVNLIKTDSNILDEVDRLAAELSYGYEQLFSKS